MSMEMTLSCMEDLSILVYTTTVELGNYQVVFGDINWECTFRE